MRGERGKRRRRFGRWQRPRRAGQRAANARESGAAHRADTYHPTPCIVAEAAEIDEAGVVKAAVRLPGRVVTRRRAAVPRAHVLADIAAEDSIAQRRAPVRIDRASSLDREIGQTARRIQLARLDD